MVTILFNNAYYSHFTPPFNLKDSHANLGQRIKNIATNLGKRSYSTLNSGPFSYLSDNITLDKAKSLLNEKKALFQLPDNFNYSEFRQLANGVFQAEGQISCRIRPGVGNSFFPIFNLVQNYSGDSLNFFFCTLWAVLDKKMQFKCKFI
jgi:hypothetical protein